MRITIRLYKRHDPDLLALYFACKNHLDFKQEIKELITAYLDDIPVIRSLPDYDCDPMISLPSKVSFHVNLDEIKDEEIIKFLRGIKLGRRNNLIKNIIRQSFPVILSPYYNDSEQKSFKISGIEEGDVYV